MSVHSTIFTIRRGGSATRWLESFLNNLPFRTMKNCRNGTKICQSRFKFLAYIKRTLKNWPKTLNFFQSDEISSNLVTLGGGGCHAEQSFSNSFREFFGPTSSLDQLSENLFSCGSSSTNLRRAIRFSTYDLTSCFCCHYQPPCTWEQ